MRRPFIILLGLSIIVAPFALTAGLVTLHLRSNLVNFAPHLADEVFYWRQIETFRVSGFEGGYYIHHELPARFTFTRFGSWGPTFPIVYGTIGRLLGWAYNSGPFYNGAILAVALLIFLALVRPDRPQMLILLVALSSYWALLLFVPTVLQESFNHAIAIVLAGLFAAVLRDPEQRRLWIPTFGFIVFAGLVRVTWVLLFLPYFLLLGRRRTWPRVVVRIFVALMTAGIVAYIYQGMVAPYPYVVNNIVLIMRSSFSQGLYLLWGYLGQELNKFLTSGYPLERLLHYQVIAYIIVLTGLLVRAVFKKNSDDPDRLPPLSERLHGMGDLGIHLINLLPVLVFVLVYFVGYWIDYRHLAQHFLFSLMLLIATRRYRLAIPIIVSNILCLPLFLSAYQTNYPTTAAFAPDREGLRNFQAMIAPYVAYKPGPNPWCNTVLTDTFDPNLLTLPSQVGFSVVIIWDLQKLPPKSKYVIADAAMEDKLSAMHLTKLDAEGDWTLYLNQDSDCENSSPRN